MYNHNKAQQCKNRVHISWDILYVWDYNMAGVAVAMVISTMHVKSCIDTHNVRKLEEKFQRSVTPLAITMM